MQLGFAGLGRMLAKRAPSAKPPTHLVAAPTSRSWETICTFYQIVRVHCRSVTVGIPPFALMVKLAWLP